MKITFSYVTEECVPPFLQSDVGMLDQIYFAPSLKVAFVGLSYLMGLDNILFNSDKDLRYYLCGVFSACLAQGCYHYDPKSGLFIWPTNLCSAEGLRIFCTCVQKKTFRGAQWLDFAGWWVESALTSNAILPPDPPVFLKNVVSYDCRIPMDFFGLRHLMERKCRLPAPYSGMHDDALRPLMIHALERMRYVLSISPNVAVSNSYQGKHQLLAPLCFEDLSKVAAAVVLDIGEDEDSGNRYYFPRTLLSLGMARGDAQFIDFSIGKSWLGTGSLHLKQAA